MTRILLVEDEESLSDPLAYQLGREGYEVAVAADGPAALAEFDRAGADLVLLDLMLPGLDGLAVCREIRRTPSVASTPVIRRSIRPVVALTTLFTVRSASDTISADVFFATTIAIRANSTCSKRM